MSSNTTPPLRILLQSKAKHLPGQEYSEILTKIKNLVCQHAWKRNFDPAQDRWKNYRTLFAYPERTCYFLLDHGSSSGEAEVPVIWLEWSGSKVVKIDRPFSPHIAAQLSKFPFNPKQRSDTVVRTTVGVLPDPETRRKMIVSRLRSKMRLTSVEVDFLRDPEQLRLLKEKLNPQLQQEVDELIKSPPAAEQSSGSAPNEPVRKS